MGVDDPQKNLFWVVRRFVGVDDPQKNMFWVARRFVGANVPQENLFGSLGDLWELIIYKRICFGL